MTTRSPIARASLPDALKLLAEVLIPTVAKGAIVRRPGAVGMAERFGLDARAVRRMQALRDKYGPVILTLPVPVVSRALVLGPNHVNRILDHTPEPYETRTDLKRGALSHFEPKGSLISSGAERTDRRAYNEYALQNDRPVHHHGEVFVDVVNEEAEALLSEVQRTGGELRWEPFFDTWFRIVRRVTFGDATRDDHEITDMVTRLRMDGNWSFFKPTKKALREKFLATMEDRIQNAAPGSLAGMARDFPSTEDTAPHHQVPQWLFAFDPAGMTTFRSLALLATHPEHARQAREEVAADESGRRKLPFLRATVLESLRLWPTTPMVLRQTKHETQWDDATLPANTEMLIFAPFFHRDTDRVPFADRFTPETWDGGKTASDLPLLPFSNGPAICPGRHVVLLVTAAFLATVLEGYDVKLTSKQELGPERALPGTLNNYGLRFQITPRG